MADVMTYEEHRGSIEGKSVVWSGRRQQHGDVVDPCRGPVRLRAAHRLPAELKPPADVVQWAEKSKGRISIGHDPESMVKNADCVVTDTWVSMGDEDPDSPSAARRHNLLRAYHGRRAPDEEAKEGRDLHALLPAHRGEEVTAEVIDGPQSVVFDEARTACTPRRASWPGACLDQEFPPRHTGEG